MLSPLLPWQPQPSYTTIVTWSVCGTASWCSSVCWCIRLSCALPLGPFIEAGAACTKWTLLVTVIKRQQGIGSQTLNKEIKTVTQLRCKNAKQKCTIPVPDTLVRQRKYSQYFNSINFIDLCVSSYVIVNVASNTFPPSCDKDLKSCEMLQFISSRKQVYL